jgi:hypothetical protein
MLRKKQRTPEPQLSARSKRIVRRKEINKLIRPQGKVEFSCDWKPLREGWDRDLRRHRRRRRHEAYARNQF